MATKPFLTIGQQIERLKSRNLTIAENQLEKAILFLLNNNYYRLSGYSLTLRRNDIFFDDATLDTFIEIYEADMRMRMRHIMLSIIEVVEVKLKSLVAYYHSEKYGPLGYLDINNFNCSESGNVNIFTVKNYLYITRKADQQKSAMAESELFLKHHRDNKNNELPFWVYVEVLTVSDISKLYTILDPEVQSKIAIQLNFRSKNAPEIVKNLLHCVTILRNICAHGGRLFNRLFIRKPWLSSREKRLLRNEDGHIVMDKLFSYILVLKSLTTSRDFKIVSEHIKQIYVEYKLIDLKYYGFPDNWEEIL